MARHRIPADVLEHNPDAAAAFWRLYGIVWSHGTVDQPTKEVARLRNARTTGCNYCKAIRFEGARRGGLTEDRVDLIDDDYACSALSARDKAVIGYVDTMLHDPHGMSSAQRAALDRELDPGQLVELTLGIGLFHGFSKIAVALGPPPEMPTMVVPTPDWPR
ncbi:MAG TPA: carboxymuconolactone decarboxylase family protein [Acidimicrobiia bacterium]|jgi:AhpD family alkylhydroperoxidase